MPARSIVAQSGGHFPPPRIGIGRRLRFGQLRQRCFLLGLHLQDIWLGLTSHHFLRRVFYDKPGHYRLRPCKPPVSKPRFSSRSTWLEAGSKSLLAGIERFRINQAG